MRNFKVSNEQRSHEINRLKTRNLSISRLFVLLLGPSATGKSTVIGKMNEQSDGMGFEYVKPIMTRANRPNETDKISVSDEEFDGLEQAGGFVVVNNLYGVRYGTPLQGILDPLREGNVPILDYPLQTVNALHRKEYDILSFYVYPSSLVEWQERMELSGRNVNGRLEAGIRELGSLATNNLAHPAIDASIVNAQGHAGRAAAEILEIIDQVTLQ